MSGSTRPDDAIPAARTWRILWPRESKRRASAFFGVQPRTPAVCLDDPAHDRQPDPGGVDLVARGERLKESPDLRLVVARDARTVVTHVELPALGDGLGADLDARLGVRVVLQRVRDE